MSTTTRPQIPTRPTANTLIAAGVPAAPPLPEDLEALLRRLRLPHIRRLAPEVIATAKAQRWEPAEVLRALFGAEAAGRDRSALATRRAAAAFPTGKTFDAWKPQASSIPAPTQQALRTLEWIGRRENLVVVDDIGLLPVAADAAEGLYRLVDAAYEKRSIAVSSNLHPAAFDELMPKTLATATVDRLLHHAHVCQTSGDSIRLSQALAGQGVRPLT